MKSLDDIKEFKIEAFEDFRGEIYTTYEKKNFDMDFIHDKVTTRRKNCLVGIHGDFKTHKLVTCLYGEVYVVAVDNRKDSEDYNECKTFILSSSNKKQILLPPGIGNSFLVLSDICVYNYKLAYEGDYIDCDSQFTLKWDDPRYNIHWPIKNPIMSERDAFA